MELEGIEPSGRQVGNQHPRPLNPAIYLGPALVVGPFTYLPRYADQQRDVKQLWISSGMGLNIDFRSGCVLREVLGQGT